MNEIPIFPLNAVLFPHTPLELHVFEPRYLQMIGDCMQADRRFGVALILHGMEAYGPLTEPYPIGCTAQVLQLEPSGKGQLDLTVIGKERFRILDLDRSSKPYLTAKIQPYPLEVSDPGVFAQSAEVLRRQFGHFVRLLASGAGKLDFDNLPDDDLGLAYLAATVLQIAPVQKQELLAARDGEALVGRLRSHYKRELALLKAIGMEKEKLLPGGFSVN